MRVECVGDCGDCGDDVDGRRLPVARGRVRWLCKRGVGGGEAWM